MELNFPKELSSKQREKTNRFTQAFGRAIELGMFGEGRFTAPLPELSSPIPQQLVQEFHLTEVPIGAFRLLWGCVQFFQKLYAPEVTAKAEWVEKKLDLLKVKWPKLPELPEDLPFEAEFPPLLHAEMRIEIDFVDDIPEAEREAVMEPFAVWDTLMMAQRDDEEEYEELTEADEEVETTTKFMVPSMLEHWVNGYFADPIYLDLIIFWALRLHNRFPIEIIIIE